MPGNHMIKVMLFDADGVVANGTPFSVYLENKFNITKEMTLPFFSGIFRDCIVGKADLKEVLPSYLSQWGWQHTVDDFLTHWFKSESSVDLDLVAYIANLRKRGILCYLATNQEKFRTDYMIRHMGFGEVFDSIFASYELGCRKPTNEYYSNIISRLNGYKKEEVLFWDDVLENVEGALSFGIKAEVYKSYRGLLANIGK